MKLRDHPALVHAGVPAWPPVWIHTRTQPFKKVEGEIGTFTGTVLNHGLPRAIFLKMEYERENYMGFLACGDAAFCCQLDTLLQRYIGSSIKDIGELDLSFTC